MAHDSQEKTVPDLTIYNLTDHWFPDKVGGSCIYAYQLHKLLSPWAKIETITLRGQPSPCENDMVVHKVLHKARLIKNRRAIRQLGRDPNAVWIVHSPWFFVHLFFALGFSVRNRVVGVYHGPWFREYFQSASAKKAILARIFGGTLRYLVELFYALYVKRFIFLSENMYRLTSRYLPVRRSQAHIIPMWSDKRPWAHPKPNNDPLVLSTFRRLEPRMGLQDLLRSLSRWDIQDYTLSICGDGPYREKLVALTARLNLQKVKFLGWVTEEEKFTLIKASDAVVIPSRSLEGFSLLALEALQHATPIILTEAVGFYEYVRDVEQDFVKKIDLNDKHQRLRHFLSQGCQRRGLDRIEILFDAGKIRTQILELLDQ